MTVNVYLQHNLLSVPVQSTACRNTHLWTSH